MRVGAIDCGTNSIRLLVADLGDLDGVGEPGDPGEAGAPTDAGARDGSAAASGPLREVLRRMEVVRLGEGLDATGAIAPAALARTLAMTDEYARQCEELGVERVRFVATSASRDASNAGDFVAGVRAAFAPRDVAPDVVSGAAEAQLSFDGSTGELAAAGVPGPYLVVDLGGGSTEFVRGDITRPGGAGQVAAAVSLDVGCVRFHERHRFGDPPSAAQVAAATAQIDAMLDDAERAVGFARVGALVGLAGTVTTVTAHALGLRAYDRDVIHGSSLPVADVLAACDDLVRATRRQRAALGFMHPGRVDVIGAGALIWSRIVTRVADRAGLSHVVTSEHDILDGIALSLRG